MLLPIVPGKDDIAGRDRVDADFRIESKPRDTGGEMVHRRFRCAIVERSAERAEPGNRADEQETAAAMLRHARNGAARQTEGRIQVLVEPRLPFVITHLQAQRRGRQPHIRHRPGDRPELRLASGERFLDRRRLGQVARKAPHLVRAEAPGKIRLRLRQRLRPPRRQRHLRALAQEALGNPVANPPARARNEDHLVLQPEIHVRLLHVRGMLY